jgi:transposase
MQRRIIGMDLGVTSAHVAVVCDETGAVIARRRCRPLLSSFEALEAIALRGADDDVALEVVIEPTGVSWLPVAVFFVRRGHTVYRVSTAKAHDMRKLLSHNAKSNGIDAMSLARLAIFDPEHLQALELASTAEQAALDRRVRATDFLTDAIGEHKTRIQELARQVMPTVREVFTNKFGKADLAVLEHYGDPRAIVALGEEALATFIAARSHGNHGTDRAKAWMAAAAEAVALYGDDPAVAYADVAAELATEARILALLEAERAAHSKAREAAYAKVDPTGLARSLPGIAAVGGPVLVASMGRPGRFANGSAFKSFSGLAPKSSGTGESETKGEGITKAGPRRLRTQLVCSANVARKLDPQLAAVYYAQMTERGAHHQKALCVVAARLAERAWVVMARGEPYVLRDTDGRPVSLAEAKQLIANRYVVPDEVRARRSTRRRQARRAPHQVL